MRPRETRSCGRHRLRLLNIIMVLVPAALGACATRARAPEPVAAPPAVAPREPPRRVALSADELRHEIDEILDAPPLHRAHWGVHIIDARTGAVVYSRNADRHFIPASNMKLAVGAAALALLGEDYRYETQVLVTGRNGDRVDGLVVVGSGDPTWSSRFYPDDAAALDSMAAAVARAGIRSAGELIVDATLFRDEQVSAAWEVGDLPWSYAPPVASFAVAEGTFSLVMEGGQRAGEPGSLRVIGPVSQPVSGTVATDTVGARASLSIEYTARRDTVYVNGRVAPGATDTSRLAVTRPAERAAAALAQALGRAGVATERVRVVRDTAVAGEIAAGAAHLTTYRSAPMRDIVAGLMQPSQNWVTEQVLKTLGAELAGDGSWAGGGAAVEQYMIEDVRVDSGAVRVRDGSGLSAQNLLTPATIVALLAYAQEQPWRAAWHDALAAPGMQGSTLSGRLRALDGRLRAKTGTISNVNALSGYVVDANGRELIFSIIVNATGLPAATAGAAIDRIARTVAGAEPPSGGN